MYMIDWESENINLNKYTININRVRSVQKINIIFDNDCNVIFLVVKIGQNKWDFYYSDLDGYEQLIQKIASQKTKVSKILKKYENSYDEMYSLWKVLTCTAVKTFKLDMFMYFRELGYSYQSDYIDEHIIFSRKKYVKYISSISEAYDCLVSILPENIEETRKLAKEENIRKLVKEYADKQREINSISEPLNSDYYISIQDNGLYQELKMRINEIKYWSKGIELQVADETWCRQRIDVLEQQIKVIKKVYEERLIQKLEDQHGTVKELKTELLKIINGLPFNDALSLFERYRDTSQELIDKKKNDLFKGDFTSYDRYIEFYQHASIFVSNYLNEINKYKSKRVLIPRSKIDSSMMYMYNANTVEEAYELKQEKNYLENRSFGEKGEAEVNYALKWLVGDYIKFDRTPSGKYGQYSIILNNKKFIDEPQEFDHIVVGPQGIFNIETKNYAGKLIIDTNGNWIRIKSDGSEIGERNPMQQIRRHEAVLKSIVGEDIPIISILVMANPKIIIEGVENFSIPLLKSDRLEEYISTYKNDKAYTKSEIKIIYDKIEQYRVSK